MALNIEKRTRALVTDNWGTWAVTTDAPPYIDTTLVEYRAANNYNIHDPVIINIDELTSGAIATNSEGEYVWQGNGIFDKVMGSVNGNIKVEYDNGRIVGQDYAATYLGGLQAALSTSAQFLLRKDTAEAQADSARIASGSAEFSLDNILPIQRDKVQEEYDLMEDTHDSKVRLAGYQADKALADTNYVDEQNAALVTSLSDNRRIKALTSLADTYGTFGAGGLTMSADMWTTYFNIVSSLVSNLNDYQGEWDASTNSPDISATLNPKIGDFYRVSTTGTTDLDGTNNWTVNDLVVFSSKSGTDTGYWKLSDISLPTTTTVTRVT